MENSLNYHLSFFEQRNKLSSNPRQKSELIFFNSNVSDSKKNKSAARIRIQSMQRLNPQKNKFKGIVVDSGAV